jgi:uncharacterized protein (AIM24 family)
VARDGALTARAQNGIYIRKGGWIASCGGIEITPARAAHAGRLAAEAFAGGSRSFYTARGDGVIVVLPGAGRRFSVVPLADETLYVRAPALYAFEAALRVEPGRAPGDEAEQVVRLAGHGLAALWTRAEPSALRLQESAQAWSRLDSLVGWTGGARVRVVRTSGGGLGVRFAGEGAILIDPAE